MVSTKPIRRAPATRRFGRAMLYCTALCAFPIPRTSHSAPPWLHGLFRPPPGPQIHKDLGYGHNARVVHATLDGRDVAIKQPLLSGRLQLRLIPADVRRIRLIHNEINVLRRLGAHPHIVRLLDSTPWEIVLERLEGVTLEYAIRVNRKHRRRLSPEATAGFLAQVASALEHVHGNGFVYNDLKPANTFCVAAPDQPPLIKLLDFAGTTPIGARPRFGFVGGAYTPPEAYTKHPRFTPAADIYSLAGLATTMLVGDFPKVTHEATKLHLKTGAAKRIKVPVAMVRDALLDQLDQAGYRDTREKRAIARALAEDPNERPQSAREFYQDFTEMPL